MFRVAKILCPVDFSKPSEAALEHAEEVARRTGRDLTVSAVYVTLLRLQKKGLVTSEMGDPTPVRGGKARRHFTVSPDGVGLLYAARERLDRMWEGLGPAPAGEA